MSSNGCLLLAILFLGNSLRCQHLLSILHLKIMHALACKESTVIISSSVCISIVPVQQGIGIEETLEAVVKRIPAPQDTASKPLRALIFDSHYDSYKVCSQLPTIPPMKSMQHCTNSWHMFPHPFLLGNQRQGSVPAL